MHDLVGEWQTFGKLSLADARCVTLPDICVNLADVLEVFDFDEQGRIPYQVLDRIRSKHDLNIISCLSMSQTHLGGIYRTHVLTHQG